MPRSPHSYNVSRSSAPPRKVRRWLVTSSFDPGTDYLVKAAKRHVHPRGLRHALPSLLRPGNTSSAPAAPERRYGLASLSNVPRR